VLGLIESRDKTETEVSKYSFTSKDHDGRGVILERFPSLGITLFTLGFSIKLLPLIQL
jgi:hypothetical protein